MCVSSHRIFVGLNSLVTLHLTLGVKLILKMYWKSLRIKTYFINTIVPVLILFFAFISYYSNSLLITSDKVFYEFQIAAEQLVLDGALHGLDDDSAVPRLGQYSRPTIDNQSLIAHQLYKEKNKDGEFVEYKSQFGLQLYLYDFVTKKISADIRFLQAISALLMSIVVVLFYFAICREFSFISAIFFCMPLILSPLVVVFAKNLYWVEATWFLPAIVTFFFGKRSLGSVDGALKMGGLLFLAFLVKMLCGYEYITAVALSACAPIVYYTIEYRSGEKRGLIQLLICGVSLFLAFSVAISLHAYSIGESWEDGLNQISMIAKKRISGQNPISLAEKSCENSVNNQECKNNYLRDYGESLTSNPFIVTAKYFALPHFLPWVDLIPFNPEVNEKLKAIRDKPTFQTALDAIRGISLQSITYAASIVVSMSAFLLFNYFVLREALRRSDSLSAGLLVSFLAPLSWFFLAKGHSYIHYSMNYVLWYLLYVPFGMLLLSKNKSVVC